MKIRSALTVRVYDALKNAGIEIPFPQHDLHLRSVSPGASAALAGLNRATRATDERLMLVEPELLGAGTRIVTDVLAAAVLGARRLERAMARVARRPRAAVGLAAEPRRAARRLVHEGGHHARACRCDSCS